MTQKISVVINTLNSQDNIERVIKSIGFADEILVCDMYSEDKTVELAKKLGARVVFHKRVEYVEPARNFAVSKATNEWVLVVDPDEEIPEFLAKKLQQIVSTMSKIDHVRIPRKNIIFGKWMKASMWWPDLNIRFFKKGKIKWTDQIHRPPEALGLGLDLSAEEELAIIHHHYNNTTEFLERMIRYTKVQAEELKKEGYQFSKKDLIKKPLGEFLSRFFANKGFEDGLHGLALSLLQAFSFLVVYIRLWEMGGYKAQELEVEELKVLSKESGEEINYWFKYGNLSKNPFKRFVQKVKNKASLSLRDKF